MVGSLIGIILLTLVFSLFEYGLIDVLDGIIPYETSKLIKIKRLTRRLKGNKLYSNKIALLTFVLQIITLILCGISIIISVVIAVFLVEMSLIIMAICIFIINVIYLGVIRIIEVKYGKKLFNVSKED